jgi:hypothetical protein
VKKIAPVGLRKSATAVTYTTRRGRIYYLHTGPKRGGGIQHFVSTDPEGALADSLPAGFETYETPNGQVYLRKKKPALIRPAELALIEKELGRRQTTNYSYVTEVSGAMIVIHEGETHLDNLSKINVRFTARELEDYAKRNAHHTPVMRFVLCDDVARVFEPERYCFRGSVEDWISIGEPDQLQKLTSKFLKYLGTDSMYELYRF